MSSVFPMHKSVCQICKEAHAAHTKCAHESLIRVINAQNHHIQKIFETNKMIPSILESNKEATTLANTFKKMAQDAAKALVVAEKTCYEFENGTQIWAKFQENLQALWANETLKQDTKETQPSEPLILSETDAKKCTEATTPGGLIVPDSYKRTPNATPVEQEPQ